MVSTDIMEQADTAGNWRKKRKRMSDRELERIRGIVKLGMYKLTINKCIINSVSNILQLIMQAQITVI